jgi:hypothetical protein
MFQINLPECFVLTRCHEAEINVIFERERAFLSSISSASGRSPQQLKSPRQRQKKPASHRKLQPIDTFLTSFPTSFHQSYI